MWYNLSHVITYLFLLSLENNKAPSHSSAKHCNSINVSFSVNVNEAIKYPCNCFLVALRLLSTYWYHKLHDSIAYCFVSLYLNWDRELILHVRERMSFSFLSFFFSTNKLCFFIKHDLLFFHKYPLCSVQYVHVVMK